MDPYLIYALLAVGGWLLRHWGFGANLQLPGFSGAASTPASTSNHPILNDALQALKKTFEAKVATELENYVKQASPAPAK